MTTFTKATLMIADKYDATVAAAVSEYNDATEVHLDGDYTDCIMCMAHIIYTMYKDGNGKVSLEEIGKDLNTVVAAMLALEVERDEN